MRIALAIVVVLLSIPLTGQLVGVGARTGWLVAGAVPGALALIGVYRLLGPRIEPVAWSAFFVLAVAPVYVTPGVVPEVTTMETVASLVMVAVALAALWTTPWLLAIAFAVHIPWDFVPRAVAPELGSLPLACLLFDGVIAAYIAWQAVSRRWSPFASPLGARPSPAVAD